MIFIFDLDGTITRQESLPLIAATFGNSTDMERLTQQAVAGEVSFAQSFAQRVDLLRGYDALEVSKLLETIPCNQGLVDFIRDHRDICRIATANLDIWVERLTKRLGCKSYVSTAARDGSRVKGIETILNKEDVVSRYQEHGHGVVFIGDADNDAAAMRQADVSIACGLSHHPAPAALDASDVSFSEEAALLDFLENLVNPASNITE